MMSLSKTEAKIINYLYQRGQEYRYAAEIARDLGIKRRTIYDSLDALEQKEIVQKQLRGKMRFYTLDNKWKVVAEAAKIKIAETDEARTLKTPSDKAEIVNNLERFLPLAERAFDAPSLDKLKDALSSMKKELKKEERK